MKPHALVRCDISFRLSFLTGVAMMIALAGMTAAVEPSFPAVDSEPLGTVAENAVVLHRGWQMRESVMAGDDGPAFSRVGFPAAGWYETTVPATPLGVAGPPRHLS